MSGSHNCKPVRVGRGMKMGLWSFLSVILSSFVFLCHLCSSMFVSFALLIAPSHSEHLRNHPCIRLSSSCEAFGTSVRLPKEFLIFFFPRLPSSSSSVLISYYSVSSKIIGVNPRLSSRDLTYLHSFGTTSDAFPTRNSEYEGRVEPSRYPYMQVSVRRRTSYWELQCNQSQVPWSRVNLYAFTSVERGSMTSYSGIRGSSRSSLMA
jgi:hypothetical protein